MPRFEKGSQEAKDFMAKIRNARKAEDYVPPANKRLTKKQKEAAEMKSTVVDIPIMGEPTLIVPEYFAIPRKNGYKLVSPMSQERNLSSRRGKKSLKIVRKPVGDIVLVREDGAEEPLPLLAFSKKDRELIKGHFKLVEKYKDKDPIDVPRIGRPKPAERGRPEKLPKNIAVHKQRKTRPGWSAKKSQKKQNEEDDDAELETKTTRRRPAAAADENIQMTVEEDDAEETPAAPAAYQRKKRQTYATDEERKEAIKQQKRDYARRKRAAAKGEGMGGSLAAADLKDLLGASYDPKVDKVGDFELDKQISSGTSKVYYNDDTGQAVVAHRGTAGISDWGNNAVYALGGKTAYKLTPRYKEAKKVQSRAEKKYGKKKVSTIGHSQGGLQAELLGGKSKEIITVNKATRPFESNTNKNQYDIRSKGDLVSGANPFGSKSKKDTTIKNTTINPLTEHSGDILDRLDKKQMIGKGGKSTKERVMVAKPKLTEAEILKILADNERLKMINAELLARAKERIAETGDPMAMVRKTAKKMYDDISNEDFMAIDRRGREIEDQLAPIQRSKALTQKAIAEADKQSAMKAAMGGRGASATVGITLEQLIEQKRADKARIVEEINALQLRTDTILMSRGLFEDKTAEINRIVGEQRQLLRRITQINNEIEELENRLYGVEEEEDDGGDTETESSSMEGEGLLDWIKTQLRGKKQPVQPYKDYSEQLDRMITQAKAEQSKAIKEGYRKDKGMPPLKPPPIAAVAPAYVMPLPVYNDMVFDDDGELMEGEGMESNYVVQSVIFKKSKYSVASAKKWLKDNKYKSPKVDETENMLRFRQMSPKMVDKKGYTEYRNKPLGKSGIELVLAYKGTMGSGFKKRLETRVKNY